MIKNNYESSTSGQIHLSRAKEILRKYPDIRQYFGPNPYSAFIILLLVTAQIALSFLLRDSSWPVLLLCAYFIGAFTNHALYGLIHECTHNLVARSTVGNRWLGILCDWALVLPSAMGFRKYHLLHHRHLGEYDFDPDLVSHKEANWVGNSPFKKFIWLTFFFVSQGIFRPLRLKKIPFWDKWLVINLISQVAVNFCLFYWIGEKAVFYLFFSTFFALGLHPLGARWIQEHYVIFPGQETNSYYGPLNKFSLNLGHHNEHHDFPKVPWNRLPYLTKRAPEYYTSIPFVSSQTRLLWRFIWDKNLGPFSRILHTSSLGK